MIRRLPWLLVFASLPAHAQVSEAETLFREGRALLEAGQPERACDHFRQSLSLAKVANTLFNVAQCDAADSELLRSLARLREGFRLLPADDDRRPLVQERIEALDARLPRVTVVLGRGAPGGTSVTLDGDPVDTMSPTPLALDPGEHVIEITALGHEVATTRFRVGESERRRVEVAPGPPLTLAEPPPNRLSAPPVIEPSPSPDEALLTAGWISLAVGGAGVVAAAVTGGLLVDRDARIRQLCPGGTCSLEGRRAIEGAEPLLVGNAVSWGLGIAGVGLGAALFVAGSIEGDEGAASIAIVPGGVVVIGAF